MRQSIFFLALISPFAAAICTFSKQPDGKIVYGMNDGGCYFCSKVAGSSIPLAGDALTDTCEQMCKSDPLCIAFEVSLPGALPVYEYFFGGRTINCCLERSDFPSSVVVDAANDNTNCGKDSLCWTRYEKRSVGLVASSSEGCEETSPSDLCTIVTDVQDFTEEVIQNQADFIEGGCDFDDEKMDELLALAREDCEAEIEAKSNGYHPQKILLVGLTSLLGMFSSFIW